MTAKVCVHACYVLILYNLHEVNCIGYIITYNQLQISAELPFNHDYYNRYIIVILKSDDVLLSLDSKNLNIFNLLSLFTGYAV